jgi:hypothetical protein
MSFYGPPVEALGRFVHQLSGAINIYKENKLSFWAGDNVVALARRFSFSRDQRFRAAFAKHAGPDDDSKMWRIATYCWAIRSAFGATGDLVECGVFKGFYAGVAVDYLDLDRSGRTFYLYDTFEGLDPEFSSERARDTLNPHYATPFYDEVVRRFAPYRNVRIVKGTVPKILSAVAPAEVAFLHLDMNAGQAEHEALEFFWPRIPVGGVVLADDFGRTEHDVYDALSVWATHVGHAFLELPTGQGLLFKTHS